MTRLQRVARGVSLLAVVVAAGAAFTEPVSVERSDARVATIGSVAAQLGVRVVHRFDEDFPVGAQFTGSLEDPAKLAAFGIKGMHVGARVIAARLGEDRVHVEADELDPPRRASVRLRLDAGGNLVKPATVASTN